MYSFVIYFLVALIAVELFLLSVWHLLSLNPVLVTGVVSQHSKHILLSLLHHVVITYLLLLLLLLFVLIIIVVHIVTLFI